MKFAKRGSTVGYGLPFRSELNVSLVGLMCGWYDDELTFRCDACGETTFHLLLHS